MSQGVIHLDSFTGRRRAAGFLSALLYPALFLWGAAVFLYYGRIGYFPPEQSMVFDGAWRILTGQRFFSDFTAPYGFVPVLLQAALSSFTGLTWWSVCLHAALANGLFCMLVYALLRNRALGRGPCFVYAMLSGVMLYPPGGPALASPHSFLFLTLLIYVLVRAGRSRGAAAALFYLLAPPLWMLAFFSRQAPATLSLIVIPLFLRRFEAGKKSSAVRLLALTEGALLSILFIFSLVHSWKMREQFVDLYFFRLPAAHAVERLNEILKDAGWFSSAVSRFSGFTVVRVMRWVLPVYLFGLLSSGLARLFGRSGRGHGGKAACYAASVCLISAGACLRDAAFLTAGSAALFVPVVFGEEALRKGFGLLRSAGLTRDLAQVLTGFLLLFISGSFLLLDSPLKGNWIPWLFLAAGTAHAAVLRSAENILPDSSRRIAAGFVTAVFLSTAACDGLSFNQSVNLTRSAEGVKFDLWNDPQNPRLLPRELRPLVWKVPAGYGMEESDFANAVGFLKSSPGNFYWFGDMTIAYAAAGKMPAGLPLWLEAGLTFPRPDHPQWEPFQRSLIERIEKDGVRYFVVESALTYRRLAPASFPLLDDYLSRHFHFVKNFGPIRIFERNPAA